MILQFGVAILARQSARARAQVPSRARRLTGIRTIFACAGARPGGGVHGRKRRERRANPPRHAGHGRGPRAEAGASGAGSLRIGRSKAAEADIGAVPGPVRPDRECRKSGRKRVAAARKLAKVARAAVFLRGRSHPPSCARGRRSAPGDRRYERARADHARGEATMAWTRGCRTGGQAIASKIRFEQCDLLLVQIEQRIDTSVDLVLDARDFSS